MVASALRHFSTDYNILDVRVNDRNDIVLLRNQGEPPEWLKISGSAFKLTKGRALHHGTLLYSSPNLKSISELLKSQGRGLIEAKGVESVRSQVANLAWRPTTYGREAQKSLITHAIAERFWKMYGKDLKRKKGRNEITLGDEVFDDPEYPQTPTLASGLTELESLAWTFDGTPRFAYASEVVDGTQVKFDAKHGAIVSLTIQTPEKQYVIEEQALQRVSTENGYGGRLTAVREWHRFLLDRMDNSDGIQLSAITIPPARADVQIRPIADTLEKIFPSIVSPAFRGGHGDN